MSEDNKFHHHEFLPLIAGMDVTHVIPKDHSYGASWKKRGGVGAFMMLARKWDRLEEMMSRGNAHYNQYDIFTAIKYQKDEDSEREEGADGTVLAEIRDLRRYLLLVEAECAARGWVEMTSAPETNGEAIVAATQQDLARAAGSGNYAAERAEAARPATPEDGGQHASRAPWVVTTYYFFSKNIDDELAGRFWRPVGHPGDVASEYALEPYVESDKIPKSLQACYDMTTGTGLVLRIARVPTDAREYFPRLRAEVNSTELDALPPWQRSLYVWIEGETKHVLAARHEAWGPEL